MKRKMAQEVLIEKASNLEESIHKFSLRVLSRLSNGSQRLNSVSSQMQILSIETSSRSIPMRDEEPQHQEGGLEIDTTFVYRELGAGLVFDGDSSSPPLFSDPFVSIADPWN